MKHLNRTNSLDRLLLVSVCVTSIAMIACSEMSAIVEKAVATRDDVQWMRVGLSSEDISVEREQSAQGR